MFGWVKRCKRNVRIFLFILATILSFPLEWGLLQGAYLWLSPYIALNRIVAQHGLLFFHSLSVIILFCCLYKRRWFCHTLCPVGWSFEFISRFSKSKTHNVVSWKIGEWLLMIAIGFSFAGIPLLAMFDPLVIFRVFFSGWTLPFSILCFVWTSVYLLILISNYFFPFFWCKHLCPLGAMQEISFVGKKKPSVIVSRRNTLLILGGWSTGLWLSHNSSPIEKKGFLPPSARDGADFYKTCLRCGNCVDACPASIIHLTRSTDSFLRWQTPRLDFSDGYCWTTCVKCGQVCPSGALAPFTLEEKNKLVIGFAEIDTIGCLLTRHKECDRCCSVCEYDAIQFIRQDLSVKIQIDRGKCVGCNACAIICPEQVIHVRPIA